MHDPLEAAVTAEPSPPGRGLWRRLRAPQAPPGFGWPLIACYALMLAPATAGALWKWNTAITFVLLIPGLTALIRLAQKAAAARGLVSRKQEPSRGTMALATGGLVFITLLVADVFPRSFYVLTVVVSLIVVFDPAWRLIWKRHESLR